MSASTTALWPPSSSRRLTRRRLLVLLVTLALIAPLTAPLGDQPAVALEDPRAWSQYLADSGNTLRSGASGPGDPGLGWFVDFSEVSTDEAPEGYSLSLGTRGEGLPVTADGMLVLRARNIESGSRGVIGVDAADGAVQWEIPNVYDLLGFCEPAIDRQNRVWLHPSGQGHVIAHDLMTGEEIDGTQLPVDARCGTGSLMIAGDGENEWLVLPGGDSEPDFSPAASPEQFTVVDISGDAPEVAWSFTPQDAPFDGTVGVSRTGTGGASNFFPRPMAADDEAVYLVGWTDDGSEAGRHELFAFALADGELLGRTDAPAPEFDPELDEEPIPATDYRRWQLLLTGDDELVVGPWTGSSDAFVAHYDLTDGLDDAEPTWLVRYPGSSHPGRLALGEQVVHVQPGGQGAIQGLSLTTGAAQWSSEFSDGPGISTLGTESAFAPVDADGASYSRGNLTGGARSEDLIKHDVRGRIEWWFHQSALRAAARDALADEELDLSFGNLTIGGIDDDGALYLANRQADWLVQVDDSGGLRDITPPEERVQDLWLFADITAVDEQGEDRQVLDELVEELAADAEDPVTLSDHHAFRATPALGAQLLDSAGNAVDEVELTTGLLELTSLPDGSDIPADLIGTSTLMVVATTTDGEIHVASGDQLALDDSDLDTLVGVDIGHLSKAFGQTLTTFDDEGLDPVETLAQRWEAGNIRWVGDDTGTGPSFRIATPFQRDPALPADGATLARSRVPITTAIDKGLFTPEDVVTTAACTFAGIAVGVAVGAGTLGIGGVAAGSAVAAGCTALSVGGTLTRLPDAIEENGRPPEPPGFPGGPSGGGWGDPHMTTFDGLDYDLHGQGEFHLVQAEDLDIQMRIAPWGNRRNLAIISGMAADVAGDVVVTDAGELPGAITINDRQVELPRSLRLDLPGGGTLYRWGGEVVLRWPDGTLLEIDTRSSRGVDVHDIHVVLPPERAGAVRGLLGDADGDAGNDLTTADGQLLEDPAFTTFYDVYAESWRVSEEQNLFPELTHDRSLPERETTLADLDADAVARAEQLCGAAGVTEAFRAACVLDVAATGDTAFAASATVNQAALRPGTLEIGVEAVAPCGEAFVDVDEGNTHACNIDEMAARDITQGVGEGRFDPRGQVPREQFATFLVRALDGVEPTPTGPFTDVDPASVHAPNIFGAAAAGITQGTSATTFAPTRLITRAEVASLLARAFDLDPVDEGPFTDVDTGNVHAGNINAVFEAGITRGTSDTTFAPDRTLRRDQMSSLLIRALDAAEDQ